MKQARWSVMARIVAGTLGAYGLTALATIALARLLLQIGVDKVEAVVAPTLASFALFSAIALAVFHARSAARAWLWLAAGATPFALLLLLLPMETIG